MGRKLPGHNADLLLNRTAMTKAMLRAELFRIKGLIRDALLEEGFKNGTETQFYGDIYSIWKEMNKNDYK